MPDVTLTFGGNATMLLRLGGFTLLTDPNFLHRGQRAYLGKGLWATRLTEPALQPTQLPPLDAILLSHLHGDHWDRIATRHLGKDTPVITTREAAQALGRKGFRETADLRPWQRHELTGDGETLRITSVPGVHGPGPLAKVLPPVMGSVLELVRDGRVDWRGYISGDTLFRPWLGEVLERCGPLDVVIPHLGGTKALGVTVTMDARQGADLVDLLTPRMTVPVHFDDYSRFSSPLGDFVEEVLRRRAPGEIRTVHRGDTISLRPVTAAPGRLAGLFAPRSIALVGATDKSGWSVNTLANIRASGFAGDVHLVNPRGGTVHGEPAYRSLAELPVAVDLAYVMVPTAHVLDVLQQGADRGIGSYVVLTAGFGEVGEEGRRLEQELAEVARDRGLTVLGPNGNGFINAAAGITPYGLPIPPPLVAGSVGIVLQSGALASSVLAFAQARNLGISLLTSMGNETVVSVTDVMDHLVDDPATRVIALFLESVRHPAEFARVARRALLAGKPVVALKIGRSSLASRTAQAHTGALVGDDGVIEAAFTQLGVVRVRSLEDLVVTAGVLAEVGPLPGPRIGVVTPSGGASEIIADRAEDEGLVLPPYAPETVAALRSLLPGFATVANPLDVTGYVVVDRMLLGNALEVVTRDPGLDAVLLLSDPPRGRPADPALSLAVYRRTAEVVAASPLPVVVMSNVLTDVSEFGRELQADTGFPHVAGSIEHGMSAIGSAVRWADVHRRAQEGTLPAWPEGPRRDPGEPGSVWAEHRAAALLAEHGIPVVPGELVADADAAVAAAERLGWPVVLKAAVEGLGHKSDVGGVRLDLRGPDEVREAHATMLQTLAARGLQGARTLVQPQRPPGGVELLVGVVRDPSWGPVLAVGLGGIWVETLRDSSLRLLPVDTGEVGRMLAELRGARLLEGARGGRPADRARLAEVVVAIGDLACRLGDRLESLEVNPLLVDGDRIEALDALVTWRG